MTASALKTLNDAWFSKLKTRWIDIVGSVAGKELFLVDGYSLIRHVLDDPLLRVAKDDCEYLHLSIRCSRMCLTVYCQLLHSVFSAEAFLHELRRRGAVFQVAFFTCTYLNPSQPASSAQDPHLQPISFPQLLQTPLPGRSRQKHSQVK
jgi:hypothetical protein